MKNGRTHYGKQRCKCQVCHRQFVLDPRHQPISQFPRDLIAQLLLERLSLAGISRVTGVSERWLPSYVNQKYNSVPRQVNVKKTRGKLIIEGDELWSFVGYKGNKQWIWLTLDASTREIVGVYIGERSRTGALGLWNSLPAVDRQCAVCYTDFWEAYKKVIPAQRHQAVGKETGKTNHIERFNNTRRQRISRLVRKARSFSKKIHHHIGAIWYFIHYYNASLAV